MGSEAHTTRFAGAPHISRISTHRRRPLLDGWRFARTPPGAATTPAELGCLSPEWLEAQVPGTVASALRCAGRLTSLDRCEDFDASDWWYSVRLPALDRQAGDRTLLRFGGLASLAEVWLGGERVASTRNMFREAEVVLSPDAPAHELTVRFASLRTRLETRHPRPRWRTTLVEHQALRWYRTTLLGRMPGWSPPVRAVGPWRPVWLEQRRLVEVVEGDVLPICSARGDNLVADLVVRTLGPSSITRADLVAPFGRAPLDLERLDEFTWRLAGTLPATDVVRWWPHTHGPQPLYPIAVQLGTSAGSARIDLGPVAFRSVVADRSSDGFTLVVNDRPVFCRGACWTPTDIVTLRGEDDAMRRRLELVREAGMNMLRVSGVMAYEDARFHRGCDELGILVWQDFMFARMDYPADDASFAVEVRQEAAEVIAARRRYASTAVWCGNSEVAQTAAMLGLEADTWASPLFDEVIPATLAASGHAAPYVSTTPTGGALPFTPSSGTAHYFGVGAMRRPLEDARRAGVRFASEALGLSNPGEQCGLPSDAGWRARIPHDAGAAWDFEDVRDHYAKMLFGVDQVELRHSDPERYLAMARIASAETMRRTFAEWRRGGSSCAGALVWLLADLSPGAGWGLLDEAGRPKSAWHALRQVLAARTVFVTDEGLGGLVAHVANDLPDVLEGTLEIALFRDGHVPLASGTRAVHVAPRSIVSVPSDAVLERFTDIAWTYRFGPPSHDLVVIEFRNQDGTLLANDLYLPQGIPAATRDIQLSARVVESGEREIELELYSERLAYAVRIEAGDWTVVDNYAHIPPGRRVSVRATGAAASRPASLVARPFNGRHALRIEVPEPGAC